MVVTISPPEKLDKTTVVRGLSCEWRGQTTEYEGQPVLVIENKHCRAVIAYQGAQVLEFQRRGHAPLLWLSEASNFLPKRAIRGGIPLCFPWFGQHPTDPSILSHGFARNLPWTLYHVTEDDSGHVLTFTFRDNEETRAIWPHAFNAMLEIRLGQLLELKFSVANVDKKPFDFTFAFHSYFAVDQIAQTKVVGLENTPFFDQLAPGKGFHQLERFPIEFHAETDRIYQRATGEYQIVQEHSKQRALIDAPDCSSAIVWNPWVEKTARLGDMDKDDWQNMLCVECGKVGAEVVTLGVSKVVSFTLTLASSFPEESLI